jgi:prepilin-type N-terminal cleavage/methylation domain-containing protein
MHKTSGFTLVELIAATAILLILTGMAIPLRMSRSSANGNCAMRSGRCATALIATKIGGKGEFGRLVQVVSFVIDPRLPGFAILHRHAEPPTLRP